MIILNCPKCSEPVTAVPGLRLTSRVRCPLCQAEYLASEALEQLPPALIVLDNPQTAADADLDELKLQPIGAGSTAGAGGFSIATDGSVAAPGPRVVSRPQRKRKPKNPVVEVVKVVGGGAFGIVIAILILFWFPVKQYRRDVLEIGDDISRISWLRVLVPPEFWAKDIDEATSDDTRDVRSTTKPRNRTDERTNGNHSALNSSNSDGGSFGSAPIYDQSKNKLTGVDDGALDDDLPLLGGKQTPSGDLNVDLVDGLLVPSKPKRGVKPAVDVDADPDAKPDTKPDEKPDTKPETPTTTKPDDEPDSKPESKPASKPDEKPDAKPDESPSVRPSDPPATTAPDDRPVDR